MNVPASQSEQEGTPSTALAVPRRQGSHEAELLAPLLGWYMPTLQLLQPVLLSRPVTSDQRPGSHGVHTEGESAPGSSQ